VNYLFNRYLIIQSAQSIAYIAYLGYLKKQTNKKTAYGFCF